MTRILTLAATQGAKKTSRKSVADKTADALAELVDQVPGKPVAKKPRAKRSASAREAMERHHLIEVAAYYVAERRGFHGASSHDDWLQAEREIDAMIADGKLVD